MVDFSTVMRRLDLLLDLMGPLVGVMVLWIGVQTHREGGSIGWPVVGAAILLVNLYVAGRRFVRHRKSASVPTSTPTPE
ncbi:hypothetical protein [Streptomyces sp. NPDC101776]|uniref:hypothetical protein n=1 Tax=Streptomyces sp. NPDC101776 TaxID=3366146 RepID=UPI0038077C41